MQQIVLNSFYSPGVSTGLSRGLCCSGPCSSLIRPPGTLVQRPYVLLLMFFILYFFRRATSDLARPIAVKRSHVIAIWVRFIMQVQKFGRTPPEEIGGQKHSKFGAISDNFRLWSRISPEQVKISKIGKTWWSAIPPAFHRKSPVNFGPLTIENYVSLNPPKLHFSGDYISATRGCWPLKF